MANTTKLYKILFVRLDSGETGHPVKQGEELAKIRGAVQNIGFYVEDTDASTLPEIVEKIGNYRPNIIHLSGHGSPNSVEAILHVMDNQPLSKISLSANEINEIFNIIPKDVNPRILFINACYAGKITSELAKSLNNRFNCLIGMTDLLDQDLALQFAETFYKRMAEGSTVEEALKQLNALASATRQQKQLADINKQGLNPQPKAYGNKKIKFTPLSGGPSREEDFSPEEWNNLCTLIKGYNEKWVNYLEKSLDKKPELKIQLEELLQAVKKPVGMNSDFDPKNISSKELINDEFIDKFEKQGLLILGNQGSGKTTILLTILDKLIKNLNFNKKFIPVFLNLSTWTKLEESFQSWLFKELETGYRLNKKDTTNLIKSGNLILLLDGLDQVPEEHLRQNFIKNLNRFRSNVNSNKSNKIILSSRLLEYENILSSNLKKEKNISKQKEYLLDLDRAFCIQPLSFEDMEMGFKEEKIIPSRECWKKLLNENEILKTPMVSFLIRKSEIKFESLNTHSSSRILEILLEKYVAKMFELQESYNADHPKNYHESKEKTKNFLKYLAKNLKKEHITIFKIEDIQPMWLSPKRCVFGYRILTGITVGLILGIIATLYFIFYLGAIRNKGAIINHNLVLGLINIGLSSGLIAGVIQGVVCYYQNTLSIEELFSILSRQNFFQTGKAALEELFSILSRQSFFQTGKAALEKPFSILSRQRSFQEGKAALEELFSTLGRRFIRSAIPGISFTLFLVFGLYSMPIIRIQNVDLLKELNVGPIYLCGLFSVGTFSFIDETIQIPLIGRIKWLKLLISSFICTVCGFFYVMFKAINYPNTYTPKNYHYAIFEIVMFIIIGLFYGGLQIMVRDENQEKEKREKSNQGIRRLGRQALLSFGFAFVFSMIASSLADNLNFIQNLRFLVCLGMATGLLAGLGANEGAGIVCIQHFILRVILYINKNIPWNYTRFLDYASQRGFLQKSGDVYWFVNGLLDYFANLK